MARIEIETKDFDFFKTFNSGLFYFFYEKKPVRKLFFNNRLLELSFNQRKENLIIDIAPDITTGEKKALKERIIYCFGLKEDLNPFYKICSGDIVLEKYLPYIRRTRIISAFSDFESLVGAIISQNNSYRNYRKQMRKVYKALNFVRKEYTKEKLKDLRLGYKTSYIMELSNNFQMMDLRKIKGLGNYSVNLYNIFQKRDYNAFYVDCLTERIMKESYDISKNFEAESKKLWGEYRGLAEAYLQRFFEQK